MIHKQETRVYRWREGMVIAVALALAVGAVALSGGKEQPGLRRQAGGTQKPAYADKIGLELDGIGDGSRTEPFVDLAKTLRPFTQIGKGDPAPTDLSGWPLTDCQTVLFNIRPVPAWAPPIDDPEQFQPDWSGTYRLSLSGMAEIASAEGPNRIENRKYDLKTNTTTAEVMVPKGSGLLVLRFANTKRNPGSPSGSGFANLHVLRPGYPVNTRQVFTTEFLKSLKPFSSLRYMDWLDTNHNPGYYGDRGHHALEWRARRLPTDATQQATGEKYGAAWEYVVLLANETNTDPWINIPVAATDDYIRQLAKFLKENLKPDLKIYIEHSNEVWNFGFPQYIYNKLAAIEEVKQNPQSPLNNDRVNNEERFAHRRHAKRLYEITRMFKQEFGEKALLTRIRPIYASWVINPDSHYRDVLKWCAATYGPPKGYFYALAGAAYYNAEKASPTARPEEILAAMRQSSNSHRRFHRDLKAIADSYGLKYTQYEIGPDNGGGSTVNVANRIRANRLSGMKDLVLYDAQNWFALGGDMYMYFASPGAYSRYGCWGLSEDVRQLNTPKWQAIYQLTGTQASR